MRLPGWLRRSDQVPSSGVGSERGDAGARGVAIGGAADSVLEGEQALREGRFEDAILALEAASIREPRAAVHLLLAEAREAGGDEEGAIDELRLALHLEPEGLESRVALVERLLRARRRAEALDLCEPGIGSGASVALRLRFAHCLMELGCTSQAVAQYEEALLSRPRDPGILSTLGLAQASSGDFAAADASYSRALESNPHCVEALHNRALLRREQGQLEAARDLFERALALRPESLETECALANALRDLGRFDEALTRYRYVLARRPQAVDALLNLSYALLMSGRLAEGWDAYERRLSFPEPSLDVPAPGLRWTGEQGVAVDVAGEQGLGDQIMFASCLPDLLRHASRVSLVCAPRLERLFARSFPEVEVRQPEDGMPRGARWAALGSLPHLFRRNEADFPTGGQTLRADPGKVVRWRARLATLGPGVRVGLSWRGGTLRTRGHLRSIPVAALAPLANGAMSASWVSLQYGNVEDDVSQLREMLGMRHWTEVGSDLDECAALVAALDLVVTIDTTVAHLAGALGKRTLILLSQAPEWRFGLEGTTMRWYPSVRLVRQPSPGDWGSVVQAVGERLAREPT